MIQLSKLLADCNKGLFLNLEKDKTLYLLLDSIYVELLKLFLDLTIILFVWDCHKFIFITQESVVQKWYFSVLSKKKTWPLFVSIILGHRQSSLSTYFFLLSVKWHDFLRKIVVSCCLLNRFESKVFFS